MGSIFFSFGENNIFGEFFNSPISPNKSWKSIIYSFTVGATLKDRFYCVAIVVDLQIQWRAQIT